MKIKELRELIKDLPDDMPVMIDHSPRYQPVGTRPAEAKKTKMWVMAFDEYGQSYGTGGSYHALVFA